MGMNQNLVVSLLFLFLGMALVIMGAIMKIMEVSLTKLSGNTVIITGMVMVVIAIGFVLYFSFENSKNNK